MEKPIHFNSNKESLKEFQARVSPTEIIDAYGEQLEELFRIRNPQYRFNPNYKEPFEQFLIEHRQGKSLEECGTWIFFPWSSCLIHFLSDEMHQELRTARNKNLITAEEQARFYNFNVGITGLSVGSHAACTLAMMGGAKNLKLADPDTISGSNLNRIRFNYSYLGKNKAESVAQYIYQLNPYSNLLIYSDGITAENISEFFTGSPKLDILVEELDNLEMKIRLRLEARKYGVPVVMATDNGDNIIVDIERYDLDQNLPIFNGLLGDFGMEDLQNISPSDIPKLATKIAGAHFVTSRMQESLLEVGKTLYSWPQLGDAATLSGVAVTYVVKRIALGEPIKSGKLEVNLDEIFDPTYDQPESIQHREESRARFLKQIGL